MSNEKVGPETEIRMSLATELEVIAIREHRTKRGRTKRR